MLCHSCRFEELLRTRLGVEVFKEDELATVVHGVSFMLENSQDELYAIEHSRCVLLLWGCQVLRVLLSSVGVLSSGLLDLSDCATEFHSYVH